MPLRIPAAQATAHAATHVAAPTGHGVAPYDVAAVRALYPALADGSAYLDGAAGTQVPDAVVEAVAAAMRSGLGNHGGAFAAARRADACVEAARAAVADLVGAPDPAGVVLGPSMTALTYRFADALATTWRPGDEVVVTRLDHDADVRPWVQAAARAGAVVRWADPVLPQVELPASAVTRHLGERTRLVALTAASNTTGTRPDVRAVADAAHAHGALVYVDGVHATAHHPTDMAALGADLYATSAYKWSGPHVGAVVATDLAVLEQLRPDKLASSPDEVPWRFERGTPPFALLAGVAAAVDHLAGLAPGDLPAEAPRRQRLLASMTAIEDHEQLLFQHLVDGLAALPHVHRVGAPARCSPTAWFTVEGHAPSAVAEHCAARGVNVWAGHMYAWELAGLLGFRDDGSAVRAGLSAYTDADDVTRLLDALAALG